jgi:hypothetical protein
VRRQINRNADQVADHQRRLFGLVAEHDRFRFERIDRPLGQALVIVPRHREPVRRRDVGLGKPDPDRLSGRR